MGAHVSPGAKVGAVVAAPEEGGKAQDWASWSRLRPAPPMGGLQQPGAENLGGEVRADDRWLGSTR